MMEEHTTLGWQRNSVQKTDMPPVNMPREVARQEGWIYSEQSRCKMDLWAMKQKDN